MEEKEFQMALSRRFHHCIDRNYHLGTIIEIKEKDKPVFLIKLDSGSWAYCSYSDDLNKRRVRWIELNHGQFNDKVFYFLELLKVGTRVLVEFSGFSYQCWIVAVGRIGKVEQCWQNQKKLYNIIVSFENRRFFTESENEKDAIELGSYVEIFSESSENKSNLIRPVFEGNIYTVLQPYYEKMSLENFDLLYPPQLDYQGSEIRCGEEYYVPGRREIGILQYGQMKKQCDVASYEGRQYHIYFNYSGIPVEEGHRYVYYYSGKTVIHNSRLDAEIEVVAELKND